jgi:hypothetical protein
MMFRVSFFVDDKHLAPVMHGLAGMARDLLVVPVANAEVAPTGKVQARKSGENYELVFMQIKETMAKTDAPHFTSVQARQACSELGLSASSWNHFVSKMVETGVVTKHGSGKSTHYMLVNE